MVPKGEWGQEWLDARGFLDASRVETTVVMITSITHASTSSSSRRVRSGGSLSGIPVSVQRN